MPTPTRAALLAAWGTAVLQGGADVDEAVAAVERSDEAHLVCHGLDGPEELAETLTGLREQGLVGLRLSLPAPGDLIGLRGPAEVNRAALAAGEAVLGVRRRQDPAEAAVPALVPAVTTFGPAGDQGHCVTWRLLAAVGAPWDGPSVAEADRALREVLREGTTALQRLAVAGGRSGAARAQALRRDRAPLRLPGDLDPRADALAERALAVLDVVAAAREDDGGSVTAHAAGARLAALVPLERAARRALVAACGAGLEAALRQPAR